MTKRLLLLSGLLLALALGGSPVGAQGERIRDFRSAITVLPDSSLQVTETIRVVAAGQQIKHGIYRDFPTRYKDRLGNAVHISFQLRSVRRDGVGDGYHLKAMSNGVRVYIGRQEAFVSSGEHTYELTYEVDREIGFFPDHDELYWNVTGNGWDFPIGQAGATVNLPGGEYAAKLHVEAYTGPQGAKGQAYQARVESDGTAVFGTTAPLGPREGLTIVVSFPKGLVQPPSAATRARLLLRDNLGLACGVVGLLVLLAYFLLVWGRVGRDLPRGTIIPLYEAPAGFSPAMVRYNRRMAFDNKAVAAAIIDLAVKGHVTITQGEGHYTLTKVREAARGALAAEEEHLLATLLPAGVSEVMFTDKQYSLFAQASNEVRQDLSSHSQNVYFVTNTACYVPGVLLSVLALGAMFAGAVLSAASIGVGVVVLGVLILGVDILFYSLMKAPTAEGRKVLDQIEGFRLYLTVAEEDRLNLQNPPQRTPELFEKFLPYALALDAEHAWAEHFAQVLQAAGTPDHPYQPGWYYGPYWSNTNPGRFTEAVGNSFAGAISSASTAPGSSSGGGGGGFSGGGGGGGGGGGW
jgi:uncharacterized membrane protein YgcG